MSKCHDVLVVKPDADGFCPVLRDCECCLDDLNHVWHFRTPDGKHFAVAPAEKQGDVLVKLRSANGRPEVVGFEPKPPTFVGRGDGVVEDNEWTIRNHVWHKLGVD